jgi:hypothetical protein
VPNLFVFTQFRTQNRFALLLELLQVWVLSRRAPNCECANAVSGTFSEAIAGFVYPARR